VHSSHVVPFFYFSGKRPFILYRSILPSTGVHSAKWTGDNGASWDDLKASIVGIMDFNIFGVPMVGADICGFLLDTNEELCARWIEVGAFYPFTRNHNALNQTPQELYLWDSVAEAGRNALNLRYRILPYLYTQFAQAHYQGLMVAQPLWAKYFTDATALSVDSQWMLGDNLLISPVITQGATSVSAYFPAGLWYAITASEFSSVPIDATAGGKFVTLSTPLTEVNVHVRGGSVLPMQDAAMTTTLARKSPFTLLVALCPYNKAFGSLFWDDGEQIELTNNLQTEFKAVVTDSTSGSLTATVVENTYADAANLSVNTVVVLSQSSLACPTSVNINGAVASEAVTVCVTVEGGSQITFSNLGIKLSDSFTLTW
jgi:alpha-glucosidase (family GH31 glycosyl hydrolase)